MIELNSSQKKAVELCDGPVMILAGAGSGKTRTLVSRILHLLEDKMVSPFRVLAVTFSNKAAKEMAHRVASSCHVDIGALQITTFHAFCARLLRSEATYLGLSRNFTIYDDSESLTIVKSIMGQRGMNQKEISPYEIRNYFDQLKNNGYYLGRNHHYEFETKLNEGIEDVFFEMFEQYEQELRKSNAIDFGGLITAVINLFEQFPEVLERYQKRYDYLLVDEYQDTNRAQFILIYLLSKSKNNICVVGDEDQSIYSWRGADIRNILDFEKVFETPQLIKLEQNYRSSETIINAASCVIENNKLRKGKKMWTDNPQGDLVQLIECLDDRSEAEFVANEIIELTNEKSKYDDIAIFYRNNAQSRLIEDALIRQRIPYRVVAGIRFYDRKEIKDILSYLRIIVNPKDSLAVARVINVPARGVGATSLRKLEELAVQNNLSLWEAIELVVDDYSSYPDIKLSSKIRSALFQLVSLINECKHLDSNAEKPSVIYEKLLNESGYLNYIRQQKNYEAIARQENLEELQNAITQFEQTEKENIRIVNFLETITLDAQVAENTEDGQVSLMTVHGSKGLEYPYVFVIGAEENIFPSYKSMEDGELGIEEERRLFYVAMTRAMQRLYILYARGRMLWGSIRFNGPSRFIDEIPKQYLNFSQLNKNKKVADEFSDFEYDDEFNQESHYDDYVVTKVVNKAKQAKFPKGVKVLHKLYGEGIVLNSDGFGEDEKISIKFLNGTQKKFAVKFSPIEII
jgi:DNA helicase-2/ATP-dependent DNA helicase PcrA